MGVPGLQYGWSRAAVWVVQGCSMGVPGLQYGCSRAAVWVCQGCSMGVPGLQYGYPNGSQVLVYSKSKFIRNKQQFLHLITSCGLVKIR